MHFDVEKNLIYVMIQMQGSHWKFQDFPVTQILREINSKASVSSKTAVLVIFGALNFVYLVNFSLKKNAEIHKIRIQSL